MTRLGEAVEALARAMGWWLKGVLDSRGRDEFAMCRLQGGSSISLWVPDCGDWIILTPIEAMLVLRCYLLGTTRVRCPDCEERGGPMGWCYAYTPYERDRLLPRQGWTYHRGVWVGGFLQWVMTRPCPTCTGPAVECDHDEGMRAFRDLARPDVPARCVKCVETNGIIPVKPTGHVDRSWAEVFLRAITRACDACDGPCAAKYDCTGDDCPMCDGTRDLGCSQCSDGARATGIIPGDPESRERLTRLADQLQAQAIDGLGGDSPEQHPDLGVWLALWIARSPCDVCFGAGSNYLCVDTDTGKPAFPCMPCSGSGLALGAHAAAMASAALELAEGLTAQAVAS